MTITHGKFVGLRAVSNSNDVIAAVAVDQRGSLRKMLTAAGKTAEDHDLDQIKEAVTDVLSQHSSAILLDPEFGLEAAKLRHGKGLFIGYEKTGYDNTVPGRMPEFLEDRSARRLVEAGADCVKVLIYYSPFEAAQINSRKQALIERVGDECKALDVPFFLEFVGYDVDGKGEKSVEYAKEEATDYFRFNERVLESEIRHRCF